MVLYQQNSYSISQARNLNSIIIGVLLSQNYLAGILNQSGGILMILAATTGIHLVTSKEVVLSKKMMSLAICLLCFFCFSILISSNKQYTIDYMMKFAAFGIVPMYFGMRKFDTRLIYITILLFGFVTIPIVHSRDYFALESGYKMGLSYAILPVMISAIICLRESILLKIMSGAVILSNTRVYMDIASRGVIFALFFFIVGYIYLAFFQSRRQKILFGTTVIFLLVGIIQYFWSILDWIQGFLNRFSISIYPLVKAIQYNSAGKFLNARDAIWSNAVTGIKQNFALGHGIGTFEQMHGGYIHNIFLQILWEGGVFLFVPFAYLCGRALSVIARNRRKEIALFTFFLFSLSVMSLLFSSVYWMDETLWFMIGFFLSRKDRTEDYDLA